MIPIVASLMSKIILTCAFSEFGCKETLTYSDIEKHEKDCPFQSIKCKYCSRNFLKQESSSHVETCDLAVVECDTCGSNFVKKEKHQHTVERCVNIQIKKIKEVFQEEIRSLRQEIIKLQDENKSLSLQLSQVKTQLVIKKEEIKVEKPIKMANGQYFVEKIQQGSWIGVTTERKWRVPFQAIFNVIHWDSSGGNGWGAAVGITSQLFSDKEDWYYQSKTYILKTGGISILSGGSTPYGKRWTQGKIIMNINQDRDLSFIVNGENFGVASKIEDEEVYLVVSLADKGRIEIKGVNLS